MSNDGKRNGDWMLTNSGQVFWPMDPRSEDVDIIDIAHALSHLCRYGGHTDRFYSVAQHSLLVSHAVEKQHALWGLLHDASEAYIADIIRPLKVHMPDYYEIERGVMNAVCDRFGLPHEMPQNVKDIDNGIIYDEKKFLMPDHDKLDPLMSGEPVGLKEIPHMTMGAVRDAFLERFYQLCDEATP